MRAPPRARARGVVLGTDALRVCPRLALLASLLFGPSLSLQDGGAQYGGSIVNYEHGLAFATVHGSGHMVPTFRPRAGLQLLAHVVQNTSFAPGVPKDSKLAAMSDDGFEAFLNDWVETAKGPGYVQGK